MPTTYDVLLSYDINTSKPADNVHSVIKQCMIDKGYADRFTYASDNKIVYLPNTTLWRPQIDESTALNDLKNCLDVYNKKNSTTHKIERFIATQFPDVTWMAFYGVAHSSNSLAPVKR